MIKHCEDPIKPGWQEGNKNGDCKIGMSLCPSTKETAHQIICIPSLTDDLTHCSKFVEHRFQLPKQQTTHKNIECIHIQAFSRMNSQQWPANSDNTKNTNRFPQHCTRKIQMQSVPMLVHLSFSVCPVTPQLKNWASTLAQALNSTPLAIVPLFFCYLDYKCFWKSRSKNYTCMHGEESLAACVFPLPLIWLLCVVLYLVFHWHYNGT